MAKKIKSRKKASPVPKVNKMLDAQIEELLSGVDASNMTKEQKTLLKQVINGNAWLVEQLELGLLTIAKMRKLFQIQGSEKAALRKAKAQLVAGFEFSFLMFYKGCGRLSYSPEEEYILI